MEIILRKDSSTANVRRSAAAILSCFCWENQRRKIELGKERSVL
jgi:hypothetical protein